VSSLEDVAEAVNAAADVNVAQLVGSQSGEPIVPVYNWANFLGGYLKTIPHLKKYRHFMFSLACPGVVMLKEYSDSNETCFPMLDDK
jgi:hypothetical protein